MLSRFIALAAALLAALPISAKTEENSPALIGPTVELDRMVVTTIPNYRLIESGWYVGEVPGFRVFSHNNTVAKRITERLQIVREAFGFVWSEASLKRLITVVVADDEAEFLMWANLPRGFMDRTTATIETAAGTVLLVNGANDAIHRGVGRGYVRALLHGGNLPPWLQEGIAQIANSAEVDGQNLVVGRVQQDVRNTVRTEQLETAGLLLNRGEIDPKRNRTLDMETKGFAPSFEDVEPGRMSVFTEVPLLVDPIRREEFQILLDGRTATFGEIQDVLVKEMARRAEEKNVFTPTSDFMSFLNDTIAWPLAKTLSPETPDSVAWRMNAWAVTHYGMFALEGKLRPTFLRFVQSLQQEKGRPAEEVLREVFGISPGKFELDLGLYARDPRYAALVFKLAEPFRATDPGFAPVLEANVLQVKARVYVATGREKAARQLLEAGYQNPENRTPAYIGQLVRLSRTEHPARADELLEQAARAEKLDLVGRRLLAESRLARLQREGAKLSPQDLRMVLMPLFAALEKGDQSEEVFVLIGRAWAASSVPPRDEHLNALRLGLTLHPQSQQLVELLKKLEHS